MHRYFSLLVIFSVVALVLAAPVVKKGDVKLAKLKYLKPPDPIDPNARPVRILAKNLLRSWANAKNNEIDPASAGMATPAHCC